ncbi:unnamed protein product [Moneuplotes crassus]|uniref:Uncharacterized protein n=1 Tax=Euplotes crassus TaxID=5936 RepID=A0AAD1XGL2_EUPCR|nr:unnamed protein product [Moneuplotes crassus]
MLLGKVVKYDPKIRAKLRKALKKSKKKLKNNNLLTLLKKYQQNVEEIAERLSSPQRTEGPILSAIASQDSLGFRTQTEFARMDGNQLSIEDKNNSDCEEKDTYNYGIFKNIDTFLTKVDINSKEEWKEETHPESPKKIMRKNLFETLREKQYNKKGLDFRKNFCHQMTTKRITINMNTPRIEQKEEVRSASPGLRRIKNNLEKLKTNPLGNMNNSIESIISLESVEFSNYKMKSILNSNKQCNEAKAQRSQCLATRFDTDDEWKHQFQSPKRTKYINSRVGIYQKRVQRKGILPTFITRLRDGQKAKVRDQLTSTFKRCQSFPSFCEVHATKCHMEGPYGDLPEDE